MAEKMGAGGRPQEYNEDNGRYGNGSSGKPTQEEKLKALERKYEDDPKAFADNLKREITEPKYIEKKVEAVVKVSPAEYRIIQSQVMDKVAARKAKGKKTKFNTYIRTANNSYKVKINGFNFKIITKYDIEKDYYILNAWSIDDD